MSVLSFKLIYNAKQIQIPTKFRLMTEISSDIYNFLIFTPQHQYEIKSKVTEEVLTSFIHYLVHEEVPEITIDNFYQYSELSAEFNILKDLIQQKKKEFGPLLNSKNTVVDNDLNLSKKKNITFEDEINQLQEIINENGLQIKNITNKVNVALCWL